MNITIDRNEGLFTPEICDLINIKSSRINELINNLNVPDIQAKENINRIFTKFTPINYTTSYSESGQTIQSNIKIPTIINSSIKVGKVNFINIVFPRVECKSWVKGHESETRVPFFRSDGYFKVCSIDVAPDQKVFFRALPLQPSPEENSYADKDVPLGASMLVKVDGGSYDVYIKGFVLDKASIPVYSFFIRTE